MTTITVLHCLAGLIVLAEALNKLERIRLPFRRIALRAMAADWLKAIAWAALAIGAAGALVSPFLLHMQPTLADACVLGGFAVLIVRTRVKEG